MAKPTGKKISKTLQEKGLLEKIGEKGNAFWKSTWTAFELGADAIEEKFTQYLDANERLLNDKDSSKKLEATIATLEDWRDFREEFREGCRCDSTTPWTVFRCQESFDNQHSSVSKY